MTVPDAPIPPAALGLLGQARHALLEAMSTPDPLQRYATAHLAALRATAALLAVRTRPVRRKGGPRNAWDLLAQIAPELREWAAYFSAGAGKRAAAEAGLRSAVTAREADDLVRDAELFVAAIAATLEQPHQALLAHG
ncbi:MAG: hypothetical protein QOE64_1170 [Frankiales bacterium]|jgi:hypothetical protein|nr:hypothetical protein [Frankiales bacterium]